MNKIYAAHVRDDGTIQSIMEHSVGTALLAKKFGSVFSGEDHAYLCGMLHDIGKYSEKFQKRILEGGHIVDHSTAGAIEINKLIPTIGFLLAYCIAGHHTGLPDGGSKADTSDESTLSGRLKKKLENYYEYTAYMNPELLLNEKLLPIKPIGGIGFSVSFYIRMLFSCLVDADFLDTEYFMDNGSKRTTCESIKILYNKLDKYIKKFENPVKEINKKRTEILHCCIDKSVWDKGIYTLTVPTGGGKTISSLAFALKHAKLHKMDRIIYVIPYNSIIEQNAMIFTDILGFENVLEHHSDIVYDDKDDSMTNKRLATENWDMPIVVTTTVQFFESLFGSKTSKCRKLHNISNSVIIFDEAQMFPVKYLIPCIRAISELVYNYGSTAVLCSATQPALNRLFPKELVIREICENTKELYKFFKGTKITMIGELSDSELSDRLNSEEQVLCIVNTRKQAQNIFNLLDKGTSYHLSTFMYPKHRKEVLEEIRNKLNNGLSCRVISTSLIEAGVDIDFPVVYREEAGLDSEIQAAGRCNRERKLTERPVYVFKSSEEYRNHMPSMLKRPTEITHSISYQYDDISSPEAITAYFSELYKFEGKGLDEKGVIDNFEDGFEKGFSFPFEEVALKFKLIENSTYAILIPADDESKSYMFRLRNGENSRKLLRQIQQYTVNIYKNSYDSLYGTGSIEPIDERIAILSDMNKYSKKTGLDATPVSGVAAFF